MTIVKQHNDPSNGPDPTKPTWPERPARMDEPEQDSPEELIRNHQAGIWRYLRFLGASMDQVDDLVQETFLELLRNQANGKFEQRSPGETAAYLRQVARNQLFARRRRQVREPDKVAIEAADVADNLWASVAKSDGLESYLDALRTCLDSLTERARDALKCFYADGQSRDQVAEQMEMKPDGVKTLLRRTRQTLRECVERKTTNP